MGLFSKKWRCAKCDTKHRKNPEECRNCGHTILQQVSTGEEEKKPRTKGNRTSSATSDSSYLKRWICNHCKQAHDEQPSQCKVCGREQFSAVGDGNSELETRADDGVDDSELDNGAEDGDDTPTFSNINEVRKYENQNSTTRTESVNYWWLATKLVVFLIAVAAVLYIL
ncbi:MULTISPECIES: hypothetical protein [Halorussus]|uniref:hypothetical protein n=1 Tax=Halorussus TaxID=1070314 RepID=UPI0013B457E1|nr:MULTISPECIES: hypothetical protein [Halorussus]NHN59891.1 hypothetical protein [Halorussus sp. JP-T4]